MVRFGMPSLVDAKTVEQCAAVCRELELDFIELNANFPQFQSAKLDAGALKEIAGDAILILLSKSYWCNKCWRISWGWNYFRYI